jgi:hypothetical protein
MFGGTRARDVAQRTLYETPAAEQLTMRIRVPGAFASRHAELPRDSGDLDADE